MPTYNKMIDRTGAEALIPESTAREIIQELPTKSIFLSLANKMPNMTTRQQKMPVMTGNVEAYFVGGDTGMKQTSQMNWGSEYITAEELAVFVPIPEAVLDDAAYDIWGEVKPRIVEAFGRKIDSAVFFGVNRPSTWPQGIVPAAVAAGNYAAVGQGTLYQAINGENGVVAKVEEQGLPVTSYVGALQLRAKLRGAVDENGQPIFRSAYASGAAGSFVYELNGTPVQFPDNGSWDAAEALLLCGDFRLARYAIRQDITYKFLDQAVITDDEGKVILNLAQQDCVALRAVMRLGWAMPKPVNPISGQEYYPFSVLKPTGISVIESAQYSVTAPAKNGTPQATHDGGAGYTAAISWAPADGAFGASTVYTATVVLTAAEGYIFANDFGKPDIVGLPATSGGGRTASSVNVVNEGAKVTITVKYLATGA